MKALRALAILHRVLTAIHLSVDLWVTYLEVYHKMYSNSMQCNKAVTTAGIEYMCQMFIAKEMEREELWFVKDLLVVAMLYNKHWDNSSPK